MAATSLKKNFETGVSFEFYGMFQNSYFIKHLMGITSDY